MSSLVFNFVFAVRNDDVESWMNILIVVVLAVFWALGGILKAKRSQQNKDTSKPSGIRRGIGSGSQRQKSYHVVPKHAFSKGHPRSSVPLNVSMEKKQPVVLPDQEISDSSILPVDIPQLESELSDISQLVDYSLKTTVFDSSTSSIEDISFDELNPATDYFDSDSLRKAILHYEILGNPVSMRDHFERFPCF